jgi:hypothetical protein
LKVFEGQRLALPFKGPMRALMAVKATKAVTKGFEGETKGFLAPGR